jgi:hypothetical protein
MLSYWHGELRRVTAGDGAEPVPFGRVASDPSRLARIDELRQRPAGELVDEIGDRVPEVAGFVDRLTADEAGRVGRHQTRGELTVSDSVQRFFASHLEEHVAQLRDILTAQSVS